VKNDLTEQAITEAVRQGLDYSVGHLDLHTEARLRRARLQALGHGNRSSVFPLFPSISSGFAAAMVATLTVTLWSLPIATNSPVMGSLPSTTDQAPFDTSKQPLAEGNAMDVLMSSEEMDFLENLDMYEWLAAEYG